jgi:hypothetical protein
MTTDIYSVLRGAIQLQRALDHFSQSPDPAERAMARSAWAFARRSFELESQQRSLTPHERLEVSAAHEQFMAAIRWLANRKEATQ